MSRAASPFTGRRYGVVRVTREWEMARPLPGDAWKAPVLPVLEHFIDRTPGSFLEEKELALVWHHRLADPEFGEWLANELVATLDEMLAETEGQKKTIQAQKEFTENLLQNSAVPTFVLDSEIGDRAVFSGVVKLEPLTATLDSMLDDAAAYAAHKAHFGDPPAK